MNIVTTYLIPPRNSLNWPLTISLSKLQDKESTKYEKQRSLYIHIMNHRRGQLWTRVDASTYVAPPGTRSFPNGPSLRSKAGRCQKAMAELVRTHNRRAQAYSRTLASQVQKQDDEDDDDDDDDDDDEGDDGDDDDEGDDSDDDDEGDDDDDDNDHYNDDDNGEENKTEEADDEEEEEEDPVAEQVEYARIIVAIHAKLARDAEEKYSNRD